MKKSQGHHCLQGQGDQLMRNYIVEDRIFEEAHNSMISNLTKYQNYNLSDKIAYAQSALSNFETNYKVALNQKNKIQEMIDRSAHGP